MYDLLKWLLTLRWPTSAKRLPPVAAFFASRYYSIHGLDAKNGFDSAYEEWADRLRKGGLRGCRYFIEERYPFCLTVDIEFAPGDQFIVDILDAITECEIKDWTSRYRFDFCAYEFRFRNPVDAVKARLVVF